MGPAFGSILRQIKKNKHSKIIGVLDNVIPHEKRKGDRLFTRFFLAPIDGYLTMAKSVEKDLSEFNQDKPRTIHPHPIFSNFGAKLERETACKELGIDSTKHTLLFFGLIREYKGLDILLESMSLVKNIEKFQVIIAGEAYTNTEKYKELISRYNLDKHVIFYNKFIPDNQVAVYFSAAEVLVLPYRSATQSGVTQIAYHFETPMIVTNVGALPEMVPHEKIGLVTEVSSAACAAAIERFYNEKLGPVFAGNFVNEKEKYTWRSFNTEILHLYSKLTT
jgi:glycosyltransferase involved in cell wall biosynthesis